MRRKREQHAHSTYDKEPGFMWYFSDPKLIQITVWFEVATYPGAYMFMQPNIASFVMQAGTYA